MLRLHGSKFVGGQLFGDSSIRRLLQLLRLEEKSHSLRPLSLRPGLSKSHYAHSLTQIFIYHSLGTLSLRSGQSHSHHAHSLICLLHPSFGSVPLASRPLVFSDRISERWTHSKSAHCHFTLLFSSSLLFCSSCFALSLFVFISSSSALPFRPTRFIKGNR